jgi:hypothetical protein
MYRSITIIMEGEQYLEAHTMEYLGTEDLGSIVEGAGE